MFRARTGLAPRDFQHRSEKFRKVPCRNGRESSKTPRGFLRSNVCSWLSSCPCTWRAIPCSEQFRFRSSFRWQSAITFRCCARRGVTPPSPLRANAMTTRAQPMRQAWSVTAATTGRTMRSSSKKTCAAACAHLTRTMRFRFPGTTSPLPRWAHCHTSKLSGCRCSTNNRATPSSGSSLSSLTLLQACVQSEQRRIPLVDRLDPRVTARTVGELNSRWLRPQERVGSS